MWEVKKPFPHRGNFVRTFFVSVVTLLVSAFLWITLNSHPTYAATEASWNDSNIVYKGNTFEKATADGSTPPGRTSGTPYWMYLTADSEAQIIYFSSSTPDTATSATFVTYDAGINGIRGSPTAGPTTISITPKNSSSSSTQAAWSGTILQYDGQDYVGENGKPFLADGSVPAGLAKGTQFYQVITPDGFVRILYFAPGVDVTTATKATFQTYAAGRDGFGAKVGPSKSVNVTPQADSPDGANSADDGGASSCAVEGVGWAVCPLSNFLAQGMDQLFNMLKGFLEVTPISTQTGSPLYQAWSVVRSIANVAFVIVFLIIIYSQITNLGVSNYGLKKLLPRLIVAAVLVNLSYIICAVAVDVSNIAGSGVQQILHAMREGLNSTEANRIDSWASVTGFILADVSATAVAAGAIGGVIITSGASLGAALILLLPMLVGLILAVLVALLVLAARQALIVILIIIAPLAFVAYLLPNTEKLFERWRGIFITMLVFYPLFALIFGGSQLAAFLIIQTAHDINVILLAMFVQVAPLVLTPLLVRFSGSIIGRIAGFVNDPKKGIIDRTRNFAKSQSEYMAARNMARRDPVRSRQVFRRFALTYDEMKRGQDERLAAYKEGSDARWTGTREYSNIQQQLRTNQDLKNEGVERASLRYDRSKNNHIATRDLDDRLRMIKLEGENEKSRRDNQWEGNHSRPVAQARLEARVLKNQLEQIHARHDAEFEEFKHGRIGNYPINANVGAMMRQTQLDSRLIAMDAMRKESATRAINETLTADLKANRNSTRIEGQLMQTYAGGVQGVAGAQRALAAAISAQTNAHNEAVKNAAAILSNGAFDDSVVTEIALGRNAGTSVVITNDMREAAIQKIASGGNAKEIVKLMANLEINTSTGANQDFRQTLSETLQANSNKPKFAGSGILANIKQGIAPAPGSGRLDAYIIETINANKLGSADTIVNQDKDYLEAVRDAIRRNRGALNSTEAANMKNAIQLARTSPIYSGKIGDNKAAIDAIYNML